LAIAALVVAIIALGVGSVGLWQARKAMHKTQPAKTTTTTTAPAKSTGTTAPAKSTGTTAPADTAEATVPDVTGQDGIAAAVKIKAAKLASDNVIAKSSTVPRGNVIKQDPAPGSKVPRTTTVHLTVSAGP